MSKNWWQRVLLKVLPVDESISERPADQIIANRAQNASAAVSQVGDSCSDSQLYVLGTFCL